MNVVLVLLVNNNGKYDHLDYHFNKLDKRIMRRRYYLAYLFTHK